MIKEPCFICLNEKDKSKHLPLICLTNSKNCKCNSRVHVKCYKKYNNYQKNKCPMCNSFITSKNQQETENETEQEYDSEQEYEAPYYYETRLLQRQNFFGIFYTVNHYRYNTDIIIILLFADVLMFMALIAGFYILIKIVCIFILPSYF